MFGLFAFVLSSLIALSPIFAQAQAVKAQNKAPVGTVLNDGAIVYKAPSFDAPVLGYLKSGKTYSISSKLFEGAFYKILVKKGVIGYIADTDISTNKKTIETMKDAREQAKKEFEAEQTGRPAKSFAQSQFGGLGYRFLDYRERTLGGMKKGHVPMIGMSLFGPGMFLGVESAFNVLMSSGAPDYYKEITGQATSGFLLLMDMTFETVFPQSQNVVTHIGFGPMLRYNKYNVQIGTTPYSLEDATIGLVLGVGGAVRMGRVALRGDLKYHHEVTQYWGAQLSLQYGF